MTQKFLILMRHAEAVDSHLKGNIFRPLTPNGHRQAFATASLLEKIGTIPQYTCLSPAVRTRETHQDMVDVWGHAPSIDHDDRLFNISHGLPPYHEKFDLVTTFNEILAEVPANVTCAMALGHNPAISNLAHTIASALPYELNQNYPTATAVILELHSKNWNSLAPRHATCKAVVYNDKDKGARLIRMPDLTPQALRAPEAK